MKNCIQRSVSIFFLGFIFLFSASRAKAEELYTRVVDVGPGLCVITKIPGNHYFLFDAGHWIGNKCFDAVSDVVDGETIDVMVFSHSDSDHLGNAPKILEHFTVNNIIRTGFERWDKPTWRKMNDAVSEEAKYGATVFNLKTSPLLKPGDTFQLGDATLTFITGHDKWPSGAGLDEAESRNVISVVMKLTYKNKSILFPGDTVGRHKEAPADMCEFAEKAMVDNNDTVSINSDIIIAPHHGGDNGSSECFIKAVSPEYVVFSAGNKFEHPRKIAVERYMAAGNIPKSHLFRTDLGDDEGPLEWDGGRITGCKDKSGDDDIEIIIDDAGQVSVKYRDDSFESCS